MRKIELLAPAKDLQCGIAAISHGADAVYIGAKRFGARAAAGNSVEDIEQNPYLSIIAEGEESGVSVVVARGGREFYVTGHLEYAPRTLDMEYRRDIGKRDDVELPKNYYRDDNPDNDPLVRWRAHANLFYANWINYYVYQETPYDINQIG